MAKVYYRVMRGFLDELANGKIEIFEHCTVIMEGINYKGRIPNKFWEDEKKGAYGIMDIFPPLKKEEMRQVREEIMHEVCERMQAEIYNYEIYNYVRFLHCLALLKVPKDFTLVPAIGKNIKYNIAYKLWTLDDGSDERWQIIDSIARDMSEALKF